jgi:triacylglycerol lipase
MSEACKTPILRVQRVRRLRGTPRKMSRKAQHNAWLQSRTDPKERCHQASDIDSMKTTADLHATSAIATLQQAAVLGTVAMVLGWTVWAWTSSPTLAIAGWVAALLGQPLVLAVQFAMMFVVNHRVGAHPVAASMLARAWWQEQWLATRVFSWHQPFCWRQWPDRTVPPAPGRRPLVLVHGFACNRGLWIPILKELRSHGVPYTTVNLEPLSGAIEGYVCQLEDAVTRAHSLTGLAPLLVCHSMGGLVARAWLAAMPGADQRVQGVVTLGTPHQGTWLARFSRAPNARQMRSGSAWLNALQAHEALNPERLGRFTCWHADADNIVFPIGSGTLPGADNRALPGVPHLALAFHPSVWQDIKARLEKG